MSTVEGLDPEACYRASTGRDARWDGRLYLGVVTTGVYCRPSCPARKPLQRNCRFFSTAAAAVAAGFRACKRCRPDRLPGSRHWDARNDLAARAVRMIRDGLVDEVGVEGLAARLAVSERHLLRVLVTEVGASAQQLARTRRAQTARMLIEQTALPLADVTFAAGFASVRQFNDVVRQEFAATPSQLRTARRVQEPGGGRHDEPQGEDPSLVLRLSHRAPLATGPLVHFLGDHAVPGLERHSARGEHSRMVPAPGGPAGVTVVLSGAPDSVSVRVRLTDIADLAPVVARVRRWLDLDADPQLVDETLSGDPLLLPLVREHPGLRVPGSPDGVETALLTVLRHGLPPPRARTCAQRLIATFGAPAHGDLTAFPNATTLAAAGPEALRTVTGLPMPRAHAVHALACAVAEGLPLGPDADRRATRAALLALPGVGASTVERIALHCLGDPDAFPASDRALQHALGVRSAQQVQERAHLWRPWRGYALMHLRNRSVLR